MTPAAARDLALDAFGFIAADPDMAGALMAASGADPAALRRMAEQPDFALFLLDFLLESDERVSAFARAAGIPPQQVLAARYAFDGPADAWDAAPDPDWP